MNNRQDRSRCLVVVNGKKRIEAMTLGWGGSNFKRRNAYGMKIRMSTVKGRKIIAGRKAKKRLELFPGEHCRNKSPSDIYTFYPREGKGWKSKDPNNLYENGFRMDEQGNGGVKPMGGWQWYMEQIKYLIDIKHGVLPFYDQYMGMRYYLVQAESKEAAAQKANEEYERFKVNLEYFDPNDYSYTY